MLQGYYFLLKVNTVLTKNTILFSLLITTLMTSGCASKVFESKGISPKKIATECKDMVYYLPKTYYRVSIHPKQDNNGNVVRSITSNSKSRPLYDITLTRYTVPDMENPICLNFKHSNSADDDYDVTISTTGLIQSVNSVNTDKSLDIALKTVELVGTIAKAASLPGSVALAYRAAEIDEPDESLEEPIINLDAVYDYQALIGGKNILENYEYKNKAALNMNLILSLTSLAGDKFPQHKQATYQNLSGNSFYYKGLVPHTLKLDFGLQTYEDIVYLPDNSPVFSYDLTRGALVKKTTNLTFTDGMLTSVAIENPSELLAAVEFPLEILKAIIAVPAELLTFKVENYNAQTNAYAAQTKLLEALIELESKKSEAAQTSQ